MYYFPGDRRRGSEAGRPARPAGLSGDRVSRTPGAGTARKVSTKGLALYDQYRNDPFIDIAFGPHAVYSVTEPDLEKILMYSEELDANIHIHLHENAAELARTKAATAPPASAICYDAACWGPRLQAVHVTQITPEEIELFAEANVQVVHCPTSNAKLASGTCPVTDHARRRHQCLPRHGWRGFEQRAGSPGRSPPGIAAGQARAGDAAALPAH